MWMRMGVLFVLGVLWSVPAMAESKTDPWTPDQVLEPADLAKLMASGKSPTILMVGPRVLYNGNHITGAIYAGPAGTPPGIALLKQEVGKLSKSADVVLYCGCCPMEKCPNIRPAFAALNDAGYSNVKILEIPTNLPTDWTAKGYPVEKGSVPKAE